MTRFKRPLLTAAMLAGTCSLATPALAANHTERDWLVKDSAHFSLHYYPGIERTSERLLRAAEGSYARLAADFGVKEQTAKKIPIIITQDSFFNGEAEPVKDRITLDPVLANSSVIGTQRFVTHELAHIMTFASVDSGNKMAMLSNVGGMPSWFLEGIAQYEAEYWYPSNDRMLRLGTLEHENLSTTERDNFRMFGVYAGAAGYNEGFALCRYMFDTYGRDKVAVLMAHMKEGKLTFDQAVNATFGQNLAAIESAWHASLTKTYTKQIAGLQDQVPGAKRIVPSKANDVNVQPQLSPDGKHLAYLSSRGQDGFMYLRGEVMGLLTLTIANADGSKPRQIELGRGMLTRVSWSADGSKLLYARIVGDANGNPCFDLFMLDPKTMENTRLTTGEMANSMAWRPHSTEVLYVAIKDGRNTIKVVDTKTKKSRTLLKESTETQYIEPAFAPSGDRVALVVHQPGEASHLAVMDMATAKIVPLTPFVERKADHTPVWTPDGRHVVFASDRTGMTNLYQIDLDGQGLRQLTNTYRGAEMPTVSPDGKQLYFTSYKARGAEIFAMPLVAGAPVVSQETGPVVPRGPRAEIPAAAGIQQSAARLTLSTPTNLPSGFEAGSLGKAVDKTLMGDAHPYRPTMTNDLLMPQMTSDEKGQQVGVAGIYSDILDKHELGYDVRFGIMSQRFSYLFQYTNNMFNSSWQVSLYDQPNIAISPDVGGSGRAVTDSLYFQRQRGVQLAALTPLGSGRSLFTGVNVGTLSTLSPPLVGDYGQLHEGQLNTLRVALRDAHVARTIDADINPSDGYALSLDWQMSDHHIGSAYDYSQYVLEGARYFPILPDQRQNLTWRWNLGLINGNAPQPFLLGGANVSNPIFALRGYTVGAASGTRLASTGLEYTIPIFQHIDKNFGPLYLDRLYCSVFSDVGSAWSGNDGANPFASVGGEIRLKTTIMGQQAMTLRFGLAQKLGSSDTPGFYLTF